MKREFFLAIGVLMLSIAVFAGHFLFFRYTFPETTIDEASFFSPAYSLATEGELSTDIHTSFLPGSSDYTYWMPPLYMSVLGIIFMITTPSVFVAKLVSFIYILSAAFILTFLVTENRNKVWLFAIVLICPFVILSSSFIRMEAMAFLIASVAIVAVRNQANGLYLGIIAALAVMTHPVLFACAAALGLISLRRGVVPFLVFSGAFLLTISPYLIYIAWDFQLFQDQMALQLIRKAERSFKDSNIMYLAQSLPVGLIGVLLLWRTSISKELKIFLFAGLILSLIIILKSLEFNYHIYLIPYLVAIVALFMDQHKENVFGKFVVPLGVYSFFALLLFAKGYTGKLNADKNFKEILQTIENDKSWEGRTIYVYGVNDVSTFLMERGQTVERSNAVANLKKEGWSRKFDYVIHVRDNWHPKKENDEAPWLSWKNQSSFTSSNGHYTLFTYKKDIKNAPAKIGSSGKVLQSFNQ